ncbi:MAG: M81 family metallopeptidase [Bacillota bacterium]|jgi:microcystin degradation protein MlrC|nr:M81 family metallopeptidase [Bacillota bacterium]HHT90625.1 M81 family metallopeptidase [Bacillota bacterium]
MKILVGELIHEGNSFSVERITLEDFGPVYGDDVFAPDSRVRGGSAEGIINTLREAGVELVPAFFGNASADAALIYSDYEKIRAAFVQALQDAGEVDGICLALHGSMYVDGEDDPEGDLLTVLRKLVGPDIPIIASLDMHATVTQRMLSVVDALVGYHTAPHVDRYETGSKAARLILRILQDGINVKMECIQIPMLLAGEQSETNESPMKELQQAIVAAEEREGIFHGSYFLGFPWADSPHNAVSIVVVGDAKQGEMVVETAKELAKGFWDRRREFRFTTEAYPLDEALRIALSCTEKPVVIADSGDNPTAGATQDLTIALRGMMENNVKNAVFVFVVDAVSQQRCAQAGIGAKLELALGRLEPVPGGSPLTVQATVQYLGTAQGIECAVVDIEGITVIIGDKRRDSSDIRTAVYDPEFLTELGLNPFDFEIIVVKSGYLSPEYQAIAARKMLALTPGDTNEILKDIPYQKVPRPIFPLDEDMEWSI